MRYGLIALLALPLFGQAFRTAPDHVVQGQTLEVYGDAHVESARFDNRTIRLFPQADGATLGLMPVGVLLKPGGYKLEWLNKAGTLVRSAEIAVGNAHYATQNVVLTKAVAGLRSTPDEREEVTHFLGELSPVRYWKDTLEAPLPGCLTSPFGVERLHNGKPTGEFHGGLDQRGPMGSPIHAAAAGVVKLSRQFNLHGGTVAIDHGQGLESMYLHMSQLAAKEGAHVEQGDVIGYVGSTGRSTGPHLHWALYVYGVPVNPQQWIPTRLESCPAPKPAPRRPPRKRAPRPTPSVSTSQ